MLNVARERIARSLSMSRGVEVTGERRISSASFGRRCIDCARGDSPALSPSRRLPAGHSYRHPDAGFAGRSSRPRLTCCRDHHHQAGRACLACAAPLSNTNACRYSDGFPRHSFSHRDPGYRSGCTGCARVSKDYAGGGAGIFHLGSAGHLRCRMAQHFCSPWHARQHCSERP